jgi:hypothetical protein
MTCLEYDRTEKEQIYQLAEDNKSWSAHPRSANGDHRIKMFVNIYAVPTDA